MNDSQLQTLILRRMYNDRKTKKEFFARDFEDVVSPSEFGRICIQLRDNGLVDWKSPAGEEMLAIGFAKITTAGVMLIERTEEKPNPQTKEPFAEKVQALCPSCQGTREALVIAKDQAHDAYYDNPEDPPITFYRTARMLKCAGCQFVFLEKSSWSDEDSDEWGRALVSTIYYPKWEKAPIPDWLEKTPRKPTTSFIFQQLRQVCLALENQLYWLACVGCRSVLETAMIEKVGDKGNFKSILEEYHKADYISKPDKEQLEIVLEAGHGATHRSFDPSPEQAKMVIDITCRILEGVYVHAPQAQTLKASIPPRQKP